MKTQNILILISIVLNSFGVSAQNEIVEAEYYLDQDPGFGNATSIDLSSGETISEAFSTELVDLDPGVYFAYVRVKDVDDMWSIPLKVPFHVQKAALPEITSAEWYIGQDPGFGSGNPIDIDNGDAVNDAVSASTEGLPAGRSVAYLRFQNADGTWSLPLKKAFMINDKFPLDVVAAEYFIDEDPGFGSATPIDVDADHFVTESFVAEVSADLPLGEHLLYTRVLNEEGQWSVNLVRTFTVGTVSTKDEELLNSISIYPIPTRDFLQVESKKFSVEELRLFDMQGRLVDSIDRVGAKVDLSHLASGSYLLLVQTAGGTVTQMIIIED